MNEIKIVLPEPAGRDAFNWLANELIERFGGYTVTRVKGCWRSGKAVDCEDGCMFTVAVEPKAQSDFVAMRVVMGLFEHTQEQAIYYRDRHGEVHIVERDHGQAG